jgi:hypothetical protein
MLLAEEQKLGFTRQLSAVLCLLSYNSSIAGYLTQKKPLRFDKTIYFERLCLADAFFL